MLRDDIELLSGKIIIGDSLTPTLYLLLKDTRDMPRLCKDLNIDYGGVERDCALRNAGEPSTDTDRGFDLMAFLNQYGRPVYLPSAPISLSERDDEGLQETNRKEYRHKRSHSKRYNNA